MTPERVPCIIYPAVFFFFSVLFPYFQNIHVCFFYFISDAVRNSRKRKNSPYQQLRHNSAQGQRNQGAHYLWSFECIIDLSLFCLRNPFLFFGCFASSVISWSWSCIEESIHVNQSYLSFKFPLNLGQRKRAYSWMRIVAWIITHTFMLMYLLSTLYGLLT